MKLSRTGWNNVIIFSVMIIILLINATNNKLFSDEEHNNKGERLILPEHSVILTLAIDFPKQQKVFFERVGRSWQLTSHGIVLDKSNQQIEQMMFAWQQSSGLIQAADVVIDSVLAVSVKIALAGEDTLYEFTLYPLADQLLIYNHSEKYWIALPPTLSQQLLPVTV